MVPDRFSFDRSEVTKMKINIRWDARNCNENKNTATHKVSLKLGRTESGGRQTPIENTNTITNFSSLLDVD